MDDEISRKIGALLRENESALPSQITSRLRESRLLALKRTRTDTFNRRNGSKILTIPWITRIGAAVLAGFVALALQAMQPTLPLDEALHPENLPVRAYQDHDFATWTATDELEEDQ